MNASAIRLGLRSLRGGLKGFRIFIACLALGVAAIAGVSSFAEALVNGLRREGAAILGGDVSVARMHREADAQERAIFSRRGGLSAVATLRAMVRAPSGEATLAEVKAVDAAYPRYGRLETAPEGGARLLERGALAEPALLARLDVKVGDTIMVGQKEVVIAGAIHNEPDKLAGGIGFGPRLLVSLETLQESGLVQPGSLVKWHYLIVAPPQEQTNAGLTRIADAIRTALPQAGFEVRSRMNASPQIEKQVLRFAEFLTLVGLSALFIGGVGVASSVTGHLERRRADIATLKTLGASGAFIALSELTQIMAFALIGTLCGLVIGAILPFAIKAAAGSAIPLPFEPHLAVPNLALAGAFGLLTALAFSIVPLSRARSISVSSLYRDQISPTRIGLTAFDWLCLMVAFGLLAVLALATAFDLRVAAGFLVAITIVFAFFSVIGQAVIALAARLPHPPSAAMRLALGNLHRPGNPTAQVVLALGLGLTLVVMMVLAESSVRRQITAVLPEKAPSFFFADIPSRDEAGFEALIGEFAPGAIIRRAPMLRGRIVAINDTPSEEITPPEAIAWMFSGDRGITYADAPPEGSRLVEGEWWPKDQATENLVSLDERLGRGLGLKRGDTITVNVLGRDMRATIHNFRAIEWESLGINFILVFSPHMFRGAPHTSLATVSLPEGTGTPQETAIVRAMAQRFPTITAVRVKEALQAVDAMSRQIAMGVRLASLITLAAAILVLGGALNAGTRARIYDAVVLKTLGAERRWLMGVYVLEFTALALIVSLFAFLVGTAAISALLAVILKVPMSFSVMAPLVALLLALTITVIIGMMSANQALKAPPSRLLREL